MSIVSWLKRRRLDDDLQEEIRAHLAIAADERAADGDDRQSARLGSLKDFGNVTLTTEAARRVWIPSWLETLRDYASDTRYALRVLAKSPAFALTVVAVLTLGIGVNAAVFTLLKGWALAPLAGIANSSQLGIIVNQTDKGRQAGLSYHDYQYVRDHDQAFSGLAATGFAIVNLGRGRSARPIYAELVSGNYFQVFGIRAERGRLLLPSDEVAPGRHPYVVINDGFWRRDFGADPDILGKTLEVNNYQLTIAGVADPAFHGTIVGYEVELFIPVMMAPQLGINVGSLQNATLITVGVATLKTIVFIGLGGLVAYLHSTEKMPVTLIQLGVAAPALLIGGIHGSTLRCISEATKPCLDTAAVASNGSTTLSGLYMDVNITSAALDPVSSTLKKFGLPSESISAQVVRGLTGYGGNNVWYVIVGWYANPDEAALQAQAIAQSAAALRVDVYQPYPDNPGSCLPASPACTQYAVVAGGNLVLQQAQLLLQQTLDAGLPDARLWRLGGDGLKPARP